MQPRALGLQGAVGETGAVFASPQRGNTMSQLHFRFFDSWDRESWSCEFQDGEEVCHTPV
jgi:hypothetical protein